MPLVDVTITATKRPAILERTLASFWEHCFEASRRPATAFRAVINVDPVGDPGPAEETVEVCREYFSEVLYRCPKEASFGNAFVWVWGSSVAPYLFHLEDDWELLKPVSFDRMLEILEENKNLALLRLNAFPTSDSAKQWNIFYPWNGEFFECPIEHRSATGFAGHPSLLRRAFVHQALPLLNPALNPEKQFHYVSALKHLALAWRFGVYGKQHDTPTICDIGRDWLKDKPFRKAGNKAFFTHWEEYHV